MFKCIRNKYNISVICDSKILKKEKLYQDVVINRYYICKHLRKHNILKIKVSVSYVTAKTSRNSNYCANVLSSIDI